MPTEVRTNTRELILDACDRLMGRYGFRKMTMDDLAHEAGISKRTIYLHFRSKEEVGLSSIGRVTGVVGDELERIASEEGDPDTKLAQMLERRVMGRVLAVQDYHHSLDELFEVVRPAYMARRKATFDRESDLIARVLREWGFAERDAAGIARTLLLATNAFLPYSLSVRELGQPDQIQRQLITMIDLLIRGIHSRRPER